MAGKILKSILSVALIVLLSSFLVITGLLYNDYSFMQHRSLEEDLLFAAAGTEMMGTEYLEKVSAEDYRITWISPEGHVLFDTDADALVMENHADREEFLEAMKTGEGDSYRYSSTLTEKTIYEAIRLSDGTVLRISISSETSAAVAMSLFYPILLIAVIAIFISVWLAHRMTKQVVEPLNKLNLDEPLSNDTYEELSPLLLRLNSQHQEIALQMKLLKQKQQEFDQITDNMKEALVLMDEDTRIISINPSAKRLFQINTDCKGKKFNPGPFADAVSKGITAASDYGHSEFTASLNQSKYLFNVSSIETEVGIHGIVILAFDVTEQANAEQTRREFTSNVSHELKTPLQSIIGSAELIENGIVKTDDMPRFIGHIRKEASRLVHLIDDIIRLSQLDEGGQIPVEPVNLLDMANEVRETLTYVAKERDISLSLTGSPVTVMGSKSLLFELLYNLTDNGIRYNKAGGNVAISLEEDENCIYMKVSDTGIGIPSEHLDKIFERFYRVDKSHSKKSGGTGLGLSIVKHAVKYHEGTIDIDSTPGKGTSITVTLKKTL